MPGIVRVDVSIDEGNTWVTADLLDGKDGMGNGNDQSFRCRSEVGPRGPSQDAVCVVFLFRTNVQCARHKVVF